VLAAYYAPDGAHVVSISSDRHMRLWDLVGGVSTTVSFGLRAPTAQRRCKASFSRDGRYMFVGNANDVHVHETASGRLVRALRGHFNEVLCTAVNPKTKDVYSAGMDESVLLWAYSKRKKKKRLQRAPASPGGGGHRQQLLFDEGDSEDDWDAMPSDASDSDSDIGRGQELPEARRRNRNARPGGADLPWNA
jgi:WD40 repeat protein